MTCGGSSTTSNHSPATASVRFGASFEEGRESHGCSTPPLPKHSSCRAHTGAAAMVCPPHPRRMRLTAGAPTGSIELQLQINAACSLSCCARRERGRGGRSFYRRRCPSITLEIGKAVSVEDQIACPGQGSSATAVGLVGDTHAKGTAEHGRSHYRVEEGEGNGGSDEEHDKGGGVE